MNYLALAIGGALGAVARFSVSRWFGDLVHTSGFPWGTLIINLVGCFVLALFLTLALDLLPIPPCLRLGFSTGFIGSFTTFSTFTLDMVQLLVQHQLGYAGLYLFASICLCIAMSAFGLVVARGIELYRRNQPAKDAMADDTER